MSEAGPVELRYKPVDHIEVEAYQLSEDTLDDLRWWLSEGTDTAPGYGSFASFSGDGLYIGFSGDYVLVPWGYWVVRGPDGVPHSCSPEMFKEAYEVVGRAKNWPGV